MKIKDERNLMIWLNGAAFINQTVSKSKVAKSLKTENRTTATRNSICFHKRYTRENQTFVSHISIYRNMPRRKKFWLAVICWHTIIWMNAELGLTVQSCTKQTNWTPTVVTNRTNKNKKKLIYDLKVREALEIRHHNSGPGSGVNEVFGAYVKTTIWDPVFHKMRNEDERREEANPWLDSCLFLLFSLFPPPLPPMSFSLSLPFFCLIPFLDESSTWFENQETRPDTRPPVADGSLSSQRESRSKVIVQWVLLQFLLVLGLIKLKLSLMKSCQGCFLRNLKKRKILTLFWTLILLTNQNFFFFSKFVILITFPFIWYVALYAFFKNYNFNFLATIAKL